MALVQLFFGLLLLFVGGESLVRGSVGIATFFEIPTIIVALTVVAFGTSAPELAINVNASMLGSAAIVFGNVIGSNIVNILIVIGLASLIYPIKVPSTFKKIDLYFLLIGNGILYVLCFKGFLSRFEGFLFLILLFVYFFSIIQITIKNLRISKREEEKIEKKAETINLWNEGLLVFSGIVLLAFGGNFLTDGAVATSKLLGIPESFIAVTIVAFGSSAPEISTTIIASIKKEFDIAIGGIVGSNLFNALGILGISAIINPIEIEASFLSIDVHFVLFSTLLLYFVLRFSKLINRYIGIMFSALYIIYVVMQIKFIT